MSEHPNIFVVVVTYRGMRWYDECFGSLRRSTMPVTTIAIDNASGDGSADYIRTHYPEVVVVESEENLGFGRANNIGMKYALEHGCDYVFLLNQDAWLDPDALEHLIRVATMHPEYGVLSPLFMDKKRQVFNITLTTHTIRNAEKMLADCLLSGHMKDVYTNDYSINAAGWLLPRHTLMTIGGFTPLIYHYGEDDDYMHRLKYHHLLMGVVPAARMVHDCYNKLDNSGKLFRQSNIDVPEDYVDINDSRNARGFMNHYLFATIKQYIHGNRHTARLYWHRYCYIRTHRVEIDYSRAQNRIKQPNWIQ